MASGAHMIHRRRSSWMAICFLFFVSNNPCAASGGFNVVTMKNGDVFNGTVAQAVFTLETTGGLIRVPYVHMARLTLSDPEGEHRLETRRGDLYIGKLENRELTVLRVLDPTLPLDVGDIDNIVFSHPVGTLPKSLFRDIIQLQNGGRFAARVVDKRFPLVKDGSEIEVSKDDIHIIDFVIQSDTDQHRAQVLENGGHIHQGSLNLEALLAETEFGDKLSFPPGALSLLAIDVAVPNPVSAAGLRRRVHPSDLIVDLLPDGAGGPTMLRLRGGRYTRGDLNGDGDADEHPVKELRIRPFAIGLHEVTFAEYDRFCTATGQPCPDDQGWGRGERPVVNVSWEEASAYAEWLSRITARRYRLPTDAEWEYAARGGSKSRFWWGDRQLSHMANCEGCGSLWDGDRSAPVGRFPPNPFGLHDTAGNVFEWVADCWHDKFDEAGDDGSALEKPQCGKRVIRGGAWSFTHHEIRSANRWRDFPTRRSDDTGFRIARDLGNR